MKSCNKIYRHWRVKYFLAVLLLLASGLAPELRALETEIGPTDDLIAAANALEPGDVLILQGGTYTVTALFNLEVDGLVGQPITIRAKAGHNPVIFRPNAIQSLIDISASYLVMEGLTLVGGARGIRLRSASDFTLRNSEIFNTEEAAFTANEVDETYLRLLVEGNNIHDTGGTGEGIILGCNSNACRVAQSVIRGNWIHDTNALDVLQGEGIDLKEGSYDNLIVDNVIHDTKFQCIVAGGTVGNGDRNRFERNALWNCGDNGIQLAADALVRNNIIIAAGLNGIAAQRLQSAFPGNIEVAHNTVVQTVGDAFRVTDVIGAISVHNNALYAQSGDAIQASGDLSGVVFAGNVGQGTLNGVAGVFTGTGNPANDFVSLGYAATPPGNPFPKPGSLLIGAANVAFLAASDFNGSDRSGDATAGAYRFDPDGNPGWSPMEGFKPVIQKIFSDGFEAP